MRLARSRQANRRCAMRSGFRAFAIPLTLSCVLLRPGTSAQDAQARAASAAKPAAIQLPGGEGGIGLDDLRYSKKLGRVLAPAGRTGNLDLVDPQSGAIESIPGFGAKEGYGGGHG